MEKLIAAIAMFALAAVSGVVGAQSTVVGGSAPGKVGIGKTMDVTATITAIDKANREITLKGPEGNEVTVAASADVKNFDKLKVGDQVMAKYARALVVELKKGGGMTVSRSEQAGTKGARPGEQPAGIVARQVTIVADVVALDPAKQTVTLRGPQRTVTLDISDPEQFKRIAKGDQVEATYTEAFAVVVEPAKK